MNIVLMGIQGSGKGTQGKLLADHLNCPHISTGDIFRENIALGTELGRKAKEFTDKGELVPDAIINDMVRSRFEKPDVKNGFVLDGFPRNGVQLAAMEFLAPVDHAIFLELDDETAIKRLHNRLVCDKCNIIYGSSRLPNEPGTCDTCGGPLKKRADDTDLDAVRRRLNVYHKEIEVLLRYYAWKDALRKFKANRSVQDVFESVLKAIRTKRK